MCEIPGTILAGKASVDNQSVAGTHNKFDWKFKAVWNSGSDNAYPNSERSLYFASLAEFEDKWEGVFPSPSLETILRKQVARARDEYGATASDSALRSLFGSSIRKQAREDGEAYRYICWHESKVESVAMWKLYTRGNDGVAIQTTAAQD